MTDTIERELPAFKKFIECNEEKQFNGFAFVNLFHQYYSKYLCLTTLWADDGADVEFDGRKYHIGEDGMTTYVMVEHPIGKVVRFNHSAYLF